MSTPSKLLTINIFFIISASVFSSIALLRKSQPS
ncbi:unnamed protein product [Brassica oleracea var. botrytis]|uniref:(rape) hypothetical protein n=1 Tax=Brassica napus TaxID=3708 RepID=A0A816IV23_BRANA|nr:unnamed protein product [Brassica napus]